MDGFDSFNRQILTVLGHTSSLTEDRLITVDFLITDSQKLSDADLTSLNISHQSACKGKLHWPALEDGVTELLHTPRRCKYSPFD